MLQEAYPPSPRAWANSDCWLCLVPGRRFIGSRPTALCLRATNVPACLNVTIVRDPQGSYIPGWAKRRNDSIAQSGNDRLPDDAGQTINERSAAPGGRRGVALGATHKGWCYRSTTQVRLFNGRSGFGQHHDLVHLQPSRITLDQTFVEFEQLFPARSVAQHVAGDLVETVAGPNAISPFAGRQPTTSL